MMIRSWIVTRLSGSGTGTELYDDQIIDSYQAVWFWDWDRTV